MRSLCESCVHVKVIDSASGSRFLMCRLAKTDARFSKYAPQPVLVCPGHERAAQPPPSEPG